MNYSTASNNKKILNYEQTKDKALSLLEFRSHSEKELREKLVRAGAKAEDIESVFEFLRKYGFLNDADYAVRKARDLKNLKRYGKRRIYAELISKGISSETANAALEELDGDDFYDTLVPLVRKKLGGDFDKKSMDKCIRYFIYRGYELSDIKRAAEEIKEEYGM